MKFKVERTGGIGGFKLSTEIDTDISPTLAGIDVESALERDRLARGVAPGSHPAMADGFVYAVAVDGEEFAVDEAAEPELCKDLNELLLAALKIDANESMREPDASTTVRAQTERGYREDFLAGQLVPLPTMRPDVAAVAEGPIHHSRFSLVQHRERHLAIFTAHNVEGTSHIDGIPREDDFRFDPLVEEAIQVDNERGYLHNPWDRGHLVRRESMHWGDRAQAVQADNETFLWTNIAPQHHDLHHGAWGKIERWLLDRIEGTEQSACIFTGPYMTQFDTAIVNAPGLDPVLLPAGYWKVGVIAGLTAPRAVAFISLHRDFGSAIPASFTPTLDQVRVTLIEHLTGLDFGELRHLDPLHEHAAPSVSPTLPTAARRETRSVSSAADIVL